MATLGVRTLPTLLEIVSQILGAFTVHVRRAGDDGRAIARASGMSACFPCALCVSVSKPCALSLVQQFSALGRNMRVKVSQSISHRAFRPCQIECAGHHSHRGGNVRLQAKALIFIALLAPRDGPENRHEGCYKNGEPMPHPAIMRITGDNSQTSRNHKPCLKPLWAGIGRPTMLSIKAHTVMPAKAGISGGDHHGKAWRDAKLPVFQAPETPAFAGVTKGGGASCSLGSWRIFPSCSREGQRDLRA